MSVGRNVKWVYNIIQLVYNWMVVPGASGLTIRLNLIENEIDLHLTLDIFVKINLTAAYFTAQQDSNR